MIHQAIIFYECLGAVPNRGRIFTLHQCGTELLGSIETMDIGLIVLLHEREAFLPEKKFLIHFRMLAHHPKPLRYRYGE